MGFREGLESFTASTLFLVAGLGIKLADIRKLGFINAFLDDTDHEPHYEKALYLLFKPNDMEEFSYWLSTEKQKGTSILEDYDYDGGYVVVVYSFPTSYHNEYEHFLKGEFSEFRKSYTNLFPDEVTIATSSGIRRTKSIHYHVFNRTPELKEYWEKEIGDVIDDEMELWSSPDLERETLDIQKVRSKETVKD